jgi:hypothetical protein
VSGKENLSLEEFAIAPRKPRSTPTLSGPEQVERPVAREVISERATEADEVQAETSSRASKALRQMKRARMKGASHFVNVNLDRDTKRRLKLASFNLETSMQALMERAIQQYLDANGF